MDVWPFPNQGPFVPEDVHGQDALIAVLIERVTQRRVTSLLGPRRFGKTSVLRRVAADLTAVGSLVVWVDLYEVASIADLAARLDAALAETGGAAGPDVDAIAAGLELHLGMMKVELRRPPRSRPDLVPGRPATCCRQRLLRRRLLPR